MTGKSAIICIEIMIGLMWGLMGMGVKEWWKKRKWWLKGGLIGFVIGMLLLLNSVFNQWISSPLVSYLSFAYTLMNYVGIYFHCNEYSCGIFFLGGLFVYPILGMVIGVVVDLIFL